MSLPAQVTVGTGTMINHNLPFDTDQEYNYSQFIYTTDEIENSGPITGIRLYKSGPDLTGADNWTVWIGATNQNRFNQSSDWIPVSQMTQVFSGTVVQNAIGEVEITFSSPFIYDGTDNIVIAIDENATGTSLSSNIFYGTVQTNNRSILYGNTGMSNNPDPNNPPDAVLTQGGLKPFTPNITFLGISNDCSVPKTTLYNQPFNLYLPSCWEEKKGFLGDINTTFTDNSSSDWDDYGFANVGTFGAARVNISSTTKREWLISPSIDLGNDNYLMSFDVALTQPANSDPSIFDPDDTVALVISTDNGITWSSANIIQSWTAGSEPSHTGTHHVVDLSAYSGVVKLGFYAQSTSYLNVKVFWLDNVSVELAGSCLKPINGYAEAIAETTATLKWQANLALGYQVAYGAGITSPDDGAILSATVDSINLSGLTPGTTYQAYVRRVCAIGDTSEWSNGFAFNTACATGLIPPYSQSFTPYLPNCWEEKQGTLGTSGTTFTTSDESEWNLSSFANLQMVNSATMRIPSNNTRKEEWLISPSFDLGSSNSYQVQFDVALTGWSDSNTVSFDMSDTLAFVISTDNGVTWDTSDIIYAWHDGDEPNNLGSFEHFDLSAYSDTVKFAFYVASNSSGGSKKVSVNNFKIGPAPTCNPPNEFTISEVTSDSISIDWSSPTASGVKIEYGPAGFTPGTGLTAIAATAPFTLTGLTPETTYDLYLHNICAVGDTSAQTAIWQFSTPCDGILPPYLEGFNAAPPHCWERRRGLLGTTNTSFETLDFSFWVADGFSNVGTAGAAKANISSSNRKEWLISPTFDLGITNNYDLMFKVALTNANSTSSTTLSSDDTLAIIISTDNGATWSSNNILQTWESGSEPSATGDLITLDLSTYSGLVKFGFYAASSTFGGSKNVYIDDFRIDTASTCSLPTSFSIADIGPDSAEVSWTTGGAASAIIEYGPLGFSPGTGITVVTSSNPYTLTGLDNLTEYQVYIRDICGIGDTSYYLNSETFTTTCPVYGPTYTQDFIVYKPDCWDEANGTLTAAGTGLSNTPSSWFSGGFGNVGSTGAARVQVNGNNVDDWLITPTFDLGNGTTDYLVEFKVALTNYSNSNPANIDNDDTLAFVISTDNGATWTTANILKAWHVGDAPSNTGVYFAADLSAYSGLVKFGFYSGSQTSTVVNSYGFIDDFRLLPIPSCVTPINLQVSNLLANSFDIGWTGSNTDTQIEYGPAGFIPGTGTLITTTANPYNISGLIDQTDYDIYIRSICAVGDTSNWTLVETVTTPCPVFDVPFYEDYAIFIPNCWTRRGGTFVNGQVEFSNSNSSWWIADGFGNVGFSGAVRLEYWLTYHNDWIISPSIDLGTSGNHRLEFDIAMTDDNSTSAANFGSDDTLFLYISTDGGLTWNQNDTLAVWYAGREPSTTGDFISIDLSAYSGEVRFGYYGKSTASGSDFNVYIDNFEIPSCPRPFDVVLDTLTATSTVISWDPMASNTFIEYGLAGFTQGNGTTLYSDSSEILINGLTPIMDYEFYLIDSCGLGDISRWNGPFSFSTPCPDYVPTYTEDFATFLPQCWEKYAGILSATTSTLTNPGAFGWTSDGFANNGFSGSARMNIVGSNIHEWLVSPTIDLGTGSTGYQVSFDVAMTDWAGSSIEIMGNDDTLALIISTDNGLTWNTSNILKTWTHLDPPSNTGDFELIELNSYSGLVKFGFYTGTTIQGNNVNVYIDNFVVDTIPACQQPLNIDIVNLSDTSAEFSWTAGAPSSIIEYGPPGYAPGTGTQMTTTGSTGIVNGLMPNTTYDFYLLDSCGTGAASLWAGPILINTNCQVIVPTYLETFDTYLPDCWSEFSGALGTNNVTITNPFSSNWNEDGFANMGSAGAARMYIYTPGNGTPVYEWLVSPSIDLGNGSTDYLLEFDVAMTDLLFSNTADLDPDDTLALLISTDDGTTWSPNNILQTWKDGVEPSNTGDHIVINLSGYTGIVKFGFYATSTVGGAGANVYIDSFELSICYPSFDSISEVICGPYTSPSGLIYNTSGIYSDTISNTMGCDSIITIDLTVNHFSDSTISETRCFSYTSDAGNVYTNSGIHTEVFTNTDGCDSTLTLNLTIVDIDLTVTVFNGAELLANESQAGATYQWLDCNNGNAPIPGETSATFTPVNNGVYACEITKDSCVGITDCTPITSVGIEAVTPGYFAIFPNPSQGQVTISLSVLPKQARVTISTVAGQQVLEQSLNAINTQLDLSKLAPGTYTIQLVDENRLATKVLVIE